MARFIDFKKVKAAVGLQQVLDRYGVTLTREGRELVARCPFHEEKTPSFKVNLEKGAGGVFHCHGCGAAGGALEFVAKREGGISVRKAAELLAEWFGIDAQKNAAPKVTNDAPAASEEREEGSPVAGAAEGVAFKPLTFTLKLDPQHPYLAERGIGAELAARLGVGFCARGIMKGRVCFPLRIPGDAGAVLVGYAGRFPGTPPEGTGGKWALPPSFPRSHYLYGLAELEEGTDEVCLVEGIFSVLRLREQLGVPAVALLGVAMSDHQVALLNERGIHRVTLLLDGDRAGRAAAGELLPRLARHFFVRDVALPDEGEPDTLPEADLRRLIGC